MTQEEELRVFTMLDAFENGKRVADLDEVEAEKAEGALIEVTDSDGESRRASLGTLLQATDAKERLDSTDKLINNLTNRVNVLDDKMAVRWWTSEKMSDQGLWTLGVEGWYYKTTLRAPLLSENESDFNESCTMDPDGHICPLIWDGDIYIPGSEGIRKGDVINGTYTAQSNAATLRWMDRSYRIIETVTSNGSRYVFTSAPCRDMDHFIVISYEEYIASNAGRVGLVVRIPGLFCTDAAQYIKDAGLMEVDYGNGCFVLVNWNGRRFAEWPDPIHFDEYNSRIYYIEKEGLTYKRCKGWATGMTPQGKRVKLDIEVSIGDTLGYRVGNNNSYTLSPFIGEDPETEKLCRAGMRYVELPFGYARSQLGYTTECYVDSSEDPLYGMYDERNVTLVENRTLSGVKCPDCAFFPGSTLRIISPDWSHRYSVNLRVIDRDADFLEKLCPTRQYYGMEPQPARFRAEVTFNDGDDQLEGIAVFTVDPRNRRMVNRAYSTADSPNTSLDIDTNAIEGKEFTLYSDLSGLKKVLRLWQYIGHDAEVTNDRLLEGGSTALEIDGHEIYRVAYHPTYYVLPDVGHDGMVPRENPQENDYTDLSQRIVELYQYKAGDYVEFVQSNGSASREMIKNVDHESGLILTGSGEALLMDANNPVTGFHNISWLGSATINQLIGKSVVIGYEYLPWSDASRDDGGQLKHVTDVSGFMMPIYEIYPAGSYRNEQYFTVAPRDPEGICLTNHVAWPGDMVTLSGNDLEPVEMTIRSVDRNANAFNLVYVSDEPLPIDGDRQYNRIRIKRMSEPNAPQRYVTMWGIDGYDWVIIKHREGGILTAVRRWQHGNSTEEIVGWHPGATLIKEWQTNSCVEFRPTYSSGQVGASEAWSEVVTNDSKRNLICFTGYFHSMREIANPRTTDRSRSFPVDDLLSSTGLCALKVGDMIYTPVNSLSPFNIEGEVMDILVGPMAAEQWQPLETYQINVLLSNGAQQAFFFYPNTDGPFAFPMNYTVEQLW